LSQIVVAVTVYEAPHVLPASAVTELPVVDPTMVPLPLMDHVVEGFEQVPVKETVWVLDEPGQTGLEGPEMLQPGHTRRMSAPLSWLSWLPSDPLSSRSRGM